MNFELARLMLGRHSHQRTRDSHVRSGLSDLIARPAAISRAWADRLFPPSLRRPSQRNMSGSYTTHMPETVECISSGVTGAEQDTRFVEYQHTSEREDTLTLSDDNTMEETSQFEELSSSPEFNFVSQEAALSETPTVFCSSPTIDQISPTSISQGGECGAENNEHESSYGTTEGQTANAGSHRKQSRSNTSPTITGAKSSSKIEKRGKRKGNNDQNNEGTDNARKKSRPPNSPGEEAGMSQRLACPFFKFDRVKHFNCLHFNLKRVKDVKQHIFRKHAFHCPYCFEIFTDSQKCDEHMEPRTCQPNMWSQEMAIMESISDDQKSKLSSRASTGRTEPEQWLSIWVILFPNTKPPPGPYVGSEIEELILTVRELWSRNGSLALSNLTSTVSFGDGSLNNMLASCNITQGGFGGIAPGATIDAVDMLLDSLTRVTVANIQPGSPGSAFFGAEFSSLQPWYTSEIQDEPGMVQDNSFGMTEQHTFWGQAPSVHTIQNASGNFQPLTAMDALPQSPPQLDDVEGQQTDEAANSQLEPLFEIDAPMPKTEQEEGLYLWEDYVVERRDLDFANEQAYR